MYRNNNDNKSRKLISSVAETRCQPWKMLSPPRILREGHPPPEDHVLSNTVSVAEPEWFRQEGKSNTGDTKVYNKLSRKLGLAFASFRCAWPNFSYG
jgi:hypothetical protein